MNTLPKCAYSACEGHVGKFMDCIDAALYEMDADETTGTVEYQGHFSLFIMPTVETHEFYDGRTILIPAGYRILGEDDRGFVWCDEYATEAEAREAFNALDAAYGEWLDQEED